jgi:hypothetical protein
MLGWRCRWRQTCCVSALSRYDAGSIPPRRRITQERIHVPWNTLITRASDWSSLQPIFIIRRHASNTALRDHLGRDAWSCALSGCELCPFIHVKVPIPTISLGHSVAHLTTADASATRYAPTTYSRLHNVEPAATYRRLDLGPSASSASLVRRDESHDTT